MLRKAIGISVIGALSALMVATLAVAQPGGGPGGGFGGGPGNFDPAQMRQMMEQRMQEQLGATDEEWKVLGPKVMKVQELSQQLNMGGRGMFGMRRGGRGGNRFGNETPAAEQTEFQKAQTALSTVLENSNASTEDITKALTAYRQAKEKAKAELATAQADLKKVLTPRQEARLVLNGMLD